MMTMLAAAQHIILEVRENAGKKPKECAIKIRLPNHTDDNGNLNLHNKRLLLIVRSPDMHKTARNEVSKKEPKLHFTSRHKDRHSCDIRVPLQKCLWTDYNASMVLERNVYMQFAWFFSFISLNRIA